MTHPLSHSLLMIALHVIIIQASSMDAAPPESMSTTSIASKVMEEKVVKLESDLSHWRSSNKSYLLELRDLVNQRFDGLSEEVRRYMGSPLWVCLLICCTIKCFSAAADGP